ncbi:coiled-coil domain-containing protein 9-like isoform X9 [Biomphalaria glabrata]|uniref:Coiled-coil domain-containing protein 9-like isoform X9 n=1 Tax=Biomphalaria glabrata TaxID=6526 RepID=A0A9W2ZZP3_BIOGL|nr:coiled-coil domain-containing protein 9-like isoform X9 [Biomphalaria glabrata]
MADGPKSNTSADTDVSLDFLTKEAKEALLSKKLDMIRQKNKVLTERHQLIEADRKKAEESGQAVKLAIDSQLVPAEGAVKSRGRGRGQTHQKDMNKVGKERPKSSGDYRDSSNYEPIVDTSDLTNYRLDHKGKGRGSHHFDGQNSAQKNKRKPASKEEGPPPDPSFNPLADRRRSDKKDESVEHRRHPRNYGGTADLNRVKQTMKNTREKEKEGPSVAKPLELVMTGKERRNHEEWKAERDKYDQERILRSQNSGGSWKRAWDVEKVNQDSEDSFNYRLEPGKRPAGRIGSGRFDRGERDERPRSAILGKVSAIGGLQPTEHVPQARPQHHVEPVTGPDAKSVRSWGRGRGRGRGHGNTPGEKSPRPRTWSGGDDRFVECQKELLLVKFDNTAGDNSVEVEYDDVPHKASHRAAPALNHTSTTSRRGPTGRTPNQLEKQSPGKAHKEKKSQKSKEINATNGVPADTIVIQAKDEVPLPELETSRVRTSSYSQSFGDSEEWEDCTESSGAQEEAEVPEQDLHLECRLNPEAPEFLPTSPDFMKTPPGHVKVLNWASDTSPRATSQSSCSLPEGSASVQALEEKESDQPFKTSDSTSQNDEEEDQFEDSHESSKVEEEIFQQASNEIVTLVEDKIPSSIIEPNQSISTSEEHLPRESFNSGETTEDFVANSSESTSAQAIQELIANTPGSTSGQTTQELIANTPGSTSGQTTQELIANTPGSTSGQTTQELIANTPGSSSGQTTQELIANTPGSSSDKIEDINMNSPEISSGETTKSIDYSIPGKSGKITEDIITSNLNCSSGQTTEIIRSSQPATEISDVINTEDMVPSSSDKSCDGASIKDINACTPDDTKCTPQVSAISTAETESSSS